MSTASLEHRLHDLLDQALALPAAQRSDFVGSNCVDEPELRERLLRLLALAEDDSGFLDRSPLALDAATSKPATVTASLDGHTIGAYRLVRKLGSGGMGEVWLGERIEGGFKQQVAIKRMHVSAGAALARFDAERDILAGLEHPRIARLYDGGVSTDGRPYMVMEYVEGSDLLTYCTIGKATLDERLKLFLQVCDAVAYAHAHLVVHRDLKPANILVNTEGWVKLLDFGIAKLVQAGGLGDATQTLHLSPAYASPEQLTGGRVGTAADVYALGVTLYQLLTGHLPWQVSDLPLGAAVQRLLGTQPLPASQGVDEHGPVPARALRGDLDAIVAKALRREPDQRYPDARALADDIRRHYRHEPVQARQGVRSYVARRFLRRNWLPLTAAAAVFMALVAGLVGIAWQARRAEQQAQRATAVQEFLTDIFRSNSSNQDDPVQARQTTARELLDLGAQKIDNAMVDAPQAKLAVVSLLGELYLDLAMDDEAVRLRRQAVELAERVHGSHSPELIQPLIDLGSSMHASAAVNEREAVLQRAMAILDRRGDDDSPLRAYLHRALAEHYGSTDLPRASVHSNTAIALFERQGPSRDLAEGLYARALIEQNQGQPAAAVASLQRAIEISSAVDGTPNANLTRYHAFLSESQFRLMQIEAARSSGRAALTTAIAINGERHVDTMQSKMRLGRLLFDTGSTQEGTQLLLEAKQLAQTIREPDDPFHTPQMRREYGLALARAGRLGDGLAEMNWAIDNRRKNRPGTRYLAVMLEGAAQTLIELGRFPQAHALLDEAVAIQAQVGLAPRTSASNAVVATRIRLLLAQGRPAEAKPLLAELFVDPAPVAGISLTAIEFGVLSGEVMLAEGDYTTAERVARDVRETLERARYADYLRFALASACLSEGLAGVRSGRPAEALPVLEQALAIRQSALLPESPKIAEAQVALAEAKRAQGQHRQARALLQQARAIHAQQPELSPHYRQALQAVEAQLDGRAIAPGTQTLPSAS